jgi:copper chaperone CopZ
MVQTLEAVCPAIRCEGCANAIRRSLGKLKGVRSADVAIETKRVVVTYDEGVVSARAVRDRLGLAGFPPE